MKNTLNFVCEFISEAVSIKKLLIVLILLPYMVFSQDLNDLKNIKSLDQMSDKDLIEYWDQAQKRGYSLDQIKTLARVQGASESDIIEFENRIKKIKPKEKTDTDNLNETQNEISSIFGLNVKESKEDDEDLLVFTDLGIFGSSFFNNPKLAYSLSEELVSGNIVINREGDFIKFRSNLQSGIKFSIDVFYRGSPILAKNPPWDGGFVWEKDKNGRPFVSVACEGDGASLWWPLKDHIADEPDEGATMTFTVPSELYCVSNGRLIDISSYDDETKRSFTWSVNNPINNYNISC